MDKISQLIVDDKMSPSMKNTKSKDLCEQVCPGGYS